MTLTIQVSADTERWLASRAAAAGTTPEGFVTGLVEKAKTGEKTFDEIAAPFRQSVAESGITEEELDALVEEAREEIYREKHGRGSKS